MGSRVFRAVIGARLHYLALPALLFIIIGCLTRLVFQLAFSDTLPLSGAMAPGFAKGFVNDVAALFFVLLTPAAMLLLPSNAFLEKRAGRVYTKVVFFGFACIFIFTAFAEYFFWDEFQSRFNFIAVDYLVYTTEMIENIVESYPLAPLLLAVFVLAVGATCGMWVLLARINKKAAAPSLEGSIKCSAGKRLAAMGGIYGTAALLFFFFTPLSVGGSQSRYWDEYAKNGVYEIFSAYLNNQLDYRAFYATMDAQVAFSIMQDNITDEDPQYAQPQGKNLLRTVDSELPEKRPNVVLVIMESMGSKWLGEYSPNLQALAGQGLSFSNMMSTGTRTVRGLEAVMLSIPPTPGNSIVRRPDNDNMFNLGTVFRERGYDLSFIYGGIGFFDNMNAFFAKNNFEVTDKTGFDESCQTFSNAWGQCDEDLYSQSLLRADKSHAAGKPFLQVLLTTSNHRPFTYPGGKVALEPGSSRRGAIQYADYALGKFVQTAKSKAWFDNTIFVFIGDHPSAIAGKTKLPPNAYGIVCVLYGPKFFKPEKVDTLCSQIDLAPTLLASIGWDYTSQFFGADARTLEPHEGRAWISTYQLLGFRDNNSLVVLTPDKGVEVTAVNPAAPAVAFDKKALAKEAIASYQCAYDLFVGKKLKEHIVDAFTPKPLAAQKGGEVAEVAKEKLGER